MKGVTFEKDANGQTRYVRFDLQQYGEELQPLLQKLGIEHTPDDWENGLTSDEFLTATKKLLHKKFNERNKVSQRRTALP